VGVEAGVQVAEAAAERAVSSSASSMSSGTATAFRPWTDDDGIQQWTIPFTLLSTAGNDELAIQVR